MYLINRNNWN